MSAHTAPAPASVRRARPRVIAPPRPILPAAPGRLLAFTALTLFGALQWAQLVEPADPGALLTSVGAALAAGVLLGFLASRRPSAWVRVGATPVVGVALLVVALAAAGVPRDLIDPRGWGELGAGIGQGLSTVPSVRIPYRGLEEWSRIVLLLGGGALVAAAALLAFVPRRGGAFGFPFAAAVALGTLYAVPAVQREVDAPFLAGLAFALLLAAFLWLEHVERRGARLALGLVTAAALLALLAAPRLDGARALLDYEEIAQSLSPATTTEYRWSHSYGPLDWPRDGREVLRIKARERAYWKATNLATFDGVRWVEDQPDSGARDVASISRTHPDWIQTIQVTVRALESTHFVAAGTTLDIPRTPRVAVQTAPGIFQTGQKPLRRGHAYRALVYTPRPSPRELRTAGPAFPEELRRDSMTILLRPDRARGTRTATPDRIVAFPFWGEAGEPLVYRRSGGPESAGATLRDSPYARTFALAQRLRARSATPFEYMRAIERHLAEGFTYSETPPRSRAPLEDFLFRDRVGYCQQFSGAMALLLRMGGVPARVAAGFAPGSLDGRREEYVVRDVDAHSWVEVYVPGIGWVTRDPTPADSPARAQTADAAGDGDAAPVTIGAGSERGLDRRLGAEGAPTAGLEDAEQDGRPVPVGLGIAGVALLGAVAVLVLRRRRGRRGPDAEAVDPALRELRRALARSGRPPRPDTTLQALARRFSGTPAEGYVRELLAARYGYGNGGPTRTQRAALRRELAAGLGVAGRLRAWWALPPRV